MPDPNGKDKSEPWGDVCERCPLDDCVRSEGALLHSSIRNYSRDHKIWTCPVAIAQESEWSVGEALINADELGLMEPVEWLGWMVEDY